MNKKSEKEMSTFHHVKIAMIVLSVMVIGSVMLGLILGMIMRNSV